MHEESSLVASMNGKISHLPWQRFHALLIGISIYPVETIELGQLNGVATDLGDMTDFLINAFDIPAGSKLDVRILANEEATMQNIISHIHRLGTDQLIEENDAILIYYAGHGATMPPPEGWHGYRPTPPSGGWPDDVEVQCIVAYDAKPYILGNKSYYVDGVILDRTLNALLRDLADKKGNNITVILDCCYSGSGTREPNKPIFRGVQLKDPNGNRMTVKHDFQETIWGRFFEAGHGVRGAIVDHKYRHAGLGSHVLLAACGSKQTAADAPSFTQALITVLNKAFLKSLSYSLLMQELKDLSAHGHRQNPLCEGNNINSVIFSMKGENVGRLRFDVIKEHSSLVLCAGAMLGITEGIEFDLYNSKAFSMKEEIIGKVRVRGSKKGTVGSTTCLFDLRDATFDLDHVVGPVASPTSASQETFLVHVEDSRLLPFIQDAIDGESPEDQYGRPAINCRASFAAADLLVTAIGNEIAFEYPESSRTHRLGVSQLLYTFPADSPRIRRILRYAAHFLKFLQIRPQHRNTIIPDHVDVHIYELEEGDEPIITSEGDLHYSLEPATGIPLQPGGFEAHAYNLIVAKDSSPEALDEAPRYGIELVNRLKGNGLFAWMFYFDPTTLEIKPYHIPRVTKGRNLIDPTLPCVGNNTAPIPVPLNYATGSGTPLKLYLYENRPVDVGYLRIFLTTKYRGGSISDNIAQLPALVKGSGGGWRGHSRHGMTWTDGAPSLVDESDVPDLWDVITIPLIQHA